MQVFGFYEIVKFAFSAFDEMHEKGLVDVTHFNNTVPRNHTSPKNVTVVPRHGHGPLYEDSNFAFITIGCIDLFIASFLLYVTVQRKYELRVMVFVAAIWSFVMAFLNLISFGITLGLKLYIEFVLFLISGLVEWFFGYVILSYFHFMTVIVERGLDEVNMAYYAEDNTVVATVPSDVQMDEAIDERPIMDDQDDFPEIGDDGNIPLT